MSVREHKILIVKLGYSETLVPEQRKQCSLGDVFRTTVLLHLFKNDRVTWLTDRAAVPLLAGNPYIARILTFDPVNILELETERFDKVINLEKIPSICAMADRIDAWNHYGFGYDPETRGVEAYEEAHAALTMATSEDMKKLNDQCWAEVLYSMLGATWHGENYILGYRPQTREQYDLGFNMYVGKLMPVKAWPMAYWTQLAGLAEGRYTVSFQECLDDLNGYIDWINSCRILITNDTLGLYLGVALGKKVLALFGPSSATEQSPHERLRVLTPPLERDCMPCSRPRCALGDSCMRYLKPSMVFEAIREWCA